MKTFKAVFIYFVISFCGYAQDCDIIILNEGAEIPSIVEEIRLYEIAYKKCENPSGPLYVISKSDVFMIRYKNGSKELFNKNTDTQVRVTSALKKNFTDLTSEEKNEIIRSKTCYKVVPLPQYGDVFSGSVVKFKKVSISFEKCKIPALRIMSYVNIDYIESEKGDIIYFNK